MTAYYNEFDPYAAQWLRNLISAGHIAPGDVDTRSIVDVQPDDLKGYTQCHFFAGIGGWSLALRLAGWPDDRPVWTGSPPCQPWSIAGKREGKADPRDLWPKFFELIRARRPAVLMGEQVAAAVGKHWLDRTAFDMESISYAIGAVVVPACAVDAPHRRDRLWFVAHPCGERRIAGRNDDAQYDRPISAATRELRNSRIVADADSCNRFWWSGPLQVGWNSVEGKASASGDGQRTQWRIKPGLPLLADGVPNRVGRLCAYGNAIVPQVAAEIIEAYLEAETDRRDLRLTSAYEITTDKDIFG